MRLISCTDAPVQLHGLFQGSLPDHLYRLPSALDAVLPADLAARAKTTAGARVRFRTDAAEVTIRMRLQTLSVDWAIPLCGSAGAVAAVGTGAGMRFAGTVCPKRYDDFAPTLTLQKQPVMEDITLFLPRNEVVNAVEFEVPDGAHVEAPTPYAVEKPVVFYGSSITEGGCASRVTNAYTALLARWLDADSVNLGFSGTAKGETPVAEYIAGLSMSAFVYDYDHNAPSPEHLAKTHAPFFRVIRKAHPTLPVLMLTKPDFDSNPADAAARRAIIRETFQSAAAEGDNNVYFIDGETFFGSENRIDCTVDGCHPNDLGFFRMANTVYPVLRRMMAENR